MNADTYKGESLGKKWARLTHWSMLRDDYARTGALDMWSGRDVRHLFLCSREGGDVGVLAHLGMDGRSMVGVDVVQEAAEACRRKWGDTPNARDALIVCGDASAVAGEVASAHLLASCFLDFCGPIGRDTMRTSCEVYRALPIGGTLSCAFLKGRERRQKPSPMAKFRSRQERRKIEREIESAPNGVLDMLSGRGDWDASAWIRTFQRRHQSSDAAGPRMSMVQQVLALADRDFPPLVGRCIEYHSRTDDGAGVPMLIMTFVKVPIDVWHITNHGIASTCRIITAPKGDALRSWRLKFVRDHDVPSISMALNVPARTAAAWKAHATRGTYAKEAA